MDESRNTKKYITQVTAFKLEENAEPFLSIEVPFGFIEDLDLRANEILEWEIDTETRTATIKKTNIIINKE